MSILKYHVERSTVNGWLRVVTGLTEHHVASNMVKELAKQTGLDRENYSILIEEA